MLLSLVVIVGCCCWPHFRKSVFIGSRHYSQYQLLIFWWWWLLLLLFVDEEVGVSGCEGEGWWFIFSSWFWFPFALSLRLECQIKCVSSSSEWWLTVGCGNTMIFRDTSSLSIDTYYTYDVGSGEWGCQLLCDLTVIFLYYVIHKQSTSKPASGHEIYVWYSMVHGTIPCLKSTYAPCLCRHPVPSFPLPKAINFIWMNILIIFDERMKIHSWFIHSSSFSFWRVPYHKQMNLGQKYIFLKLRMGKTV